MSAWIVSKAHIDALVQSMVVERVIEADEATDIGSMLWTENHRSINYRYEDENAEVPAYRFAGIEAPLDDLVMLKNVACYGYQSCEHPAWAVSAAKSLTDELAERIASRNGGDVEVWVRADDGVPWEQQSPWGIDDIAQAVAKVAAR